MCFVCDIFLWCVYGVCEVCVKFRVFLGVYCVLCDCVCNMSSVCLWFVCVLVCMMCLCLKCGYACVCGLYVCVEFQVCVGHVLLCVCVCVCGL